MSRLRFGRNVGILGMAVWNKGALRPTFIEMDWGVRERLRKVMSKVV